MVLEGLGEGEDEAMQLPVHMEYLIVYYISYNSSLFINEGNSINNINERFIISYLHDINHCPIEV